ncbi:uncharacterized protein ARMOST_04450 [Armillaria ostoyae]|uniref:Uncharacterized protein n=1 Tax=Armillaria ostoyae TaxID=47428 RepID=A0A284QXJ0_ARMOS|nr:uncharacterized protein ARMOST_04450 [Armillaria ostoyae]
MYSSTEPDVRNANAAFAQDPAQSHQVAGGETHFDIFIDHAEFAAPLNESKHPGYSLQQKNFWHNQVHHAP